MIIRELVRVHVQLERQAVEEEVENPLQWSGEDPEEDEQQAEPRGQVQQVEPSDDGEQEETQGDEAIEEPQGPRRQGEQTRSHGDGEVVPDDLPDQVCRH